MTKLIIILPCYNEADVLDLTTATIDEYLCRFIEKGLIAPESYALYVDDGSIDATWEKIAHHAKSNSRINGLRLSRNYGHQLALSAGMHEANGECDICISMDADLQHDPDVLETFITRFLNGADVVLGVREDRHSDSWVKRKSAQGFYKFAKRLGVNLVPGHADFRLLSARALHITCQYQESDPFFRGIVPLIGLTTETVPFSVKPRAQGQSKYTFRKMIHLALTGITSFSIMPLRLVGLLGIIVTLVSISFATYALWVRLFTDNALPGWTSTVIPIYLIAGVQMIAFGIIGEYIGRIFLEVKNRPGFVIMDRTDD